MPTKSYPLHPEFDELLNSCGSMTKQLEALGGHLSVKLLHEGIEENCFRRYTILSLNEIPVIAACSSTTLTSNFFIDVLKNARTTPIGKFLFATPAVIRDEVLISLAPQADIIKPYLKEFVQTNYSIESAFWQRKSYFHYKQQAMELIEIILPELESFFA